MEMENSDSRKRPLDLDVDVKENGTIKRSNPGVGEQDEEALAYTSLDNVHLKILVPSIAAGGIIGKGGETITQIQKETGANIKMSKANDFYPGTTERVCLITGNAESARNAHNWIMERIREKPDPNPKPVEGELKIKILVPNSTAGMIIGKGGNYIRQIKEESGAYVQISQKSKDLSLPERCVTVAGIDGDIDQNKKALDMILQKIVEDPQSGSCPNISYADIKGPVASSNPTGSPFAQGGQRVEQGYGGGGPGPGPQTGVYTNIGNSMNNLTLNAAAAGGNPGMGGMDRGGGGGGGNGGGGGGGGGGSNQAMEHLRATLRGSGYSEQAVDELSHAMYTLANYGFLGMGLGLAGLSMGMGSGVGGNATGGQQGAQAANMALSNLAGLLGGGGSNNNNQNASGGGGSLLGGNGGNAGGSGESTPSVFGPAGSTTTTMAGGDTGEGSGSYFATAGGLNGSGDTMFGGGFGGSGSFSGSSGGFGNGNQNSFGLGTGMGTFPTAEPSGEDSPMADGNKKEMEVGEHIVGAILGPGGKGIVELQKITGANIQISKKGVFAPGTRNRVVTINGTPGAIQRAQFLIQQRITQEETKRARQNPGGQNMNQ